MNAAVTKLANELLDSEENNNNNNNNVFLCNLKPVFEACDYNGDGYVKVQDLIELGQQYIGLDGKKDELSPILRQLDANGDGRITFEEFSEKVPELLHASSQEASNSSTMECTDFDPVKIGFGEEEHRARSYTDSEGFFEENDIESTSTTSNDFCRDLDEAHSTPYKNNQVAPSNYFERIKRNTSIYSTYPPNGKRPRHSPATVYDLPRHQLSRTSEYQSQEENNNWDDDSCSIPIAENQSGLSNHRLSGNLVARHLREVKSAQNSLHGSMEDMATLNRRHSISEGENDYNYLMEQVKKLSSQVLLMKINQDSHEDKHKKMQGENRTLVNRINTLEEQLIDSKNTSVEAVEAEGQKYQKQLAKLQRDHEDSIEELNGKIREAEVEIENLKTVEPMLKKELEINLEERRLAHQKIEVLQKELLEKEKEIEHLRYKLKSKTEELEREREERHEEVLLLTQQVQSLKFVQHEANNTFNERNDYLQKMEILQKDNDELKHSQDELRNQLLENSASLSLKEEKSLADELVTANKDDVLTALRTQETENHRLRQYIDQLLIMIMQTDPELLEK